MKLDFVLKLFKPLIKKWVTNELANPITRNKIVDLVNDKVDLPKMDEAQERALFVKIYDAIDESVILVIDRL